MKSKIKVKSNPVFPIQNFDFLHAQNEILKYACLQTTQKLIIAIAGIK